MIRCAIWVLTDRHPFIEIDTPGHADFGGEVERILSMVDGVALIVGRFIDKGIVERSDLGVSLSVVDRSVIS